ncbi:hypothetical protein VT84_12625 [Gemmata sp. SH-PL17]|nr:hypothetical protein VT84_12625 [Gemmata sp. SH-PL17]
MLFAPVKELFDQVYRVAHELSNHDARSEAEVRSHPISTQNSQLRLLNSGSRVRVSLGVRAKPGVILSVPWSDTIYP